MLKLQLSDLKNVTKRRYMLRQVVGGGAGVGAMEHCVQY